MQIRLQQLEHQQKALAAVSHVFNNVDLDNSSANEANPLFDPADSQIVKNIEQIQSGEIDGLDKIPELWRTKIEDSVLGIDVKMETGTGKTLVYTQLMYELNRRYGFHKFIVLVPSTAIKEGSKSFIFSDYARQYFNDAYGNAIRLNLHVLDPQKAKKGRKFFPTAIDNFVNASRLEVGRVSALLMTDGMLLSRKTMDFAYDQTVLGGSSRPYEALKETRSVVIIDEPHRFRRENKAYQTLLDEIQPQAIIRFGATFPTKERSTETDYNNLVFNLDAIDAFNDGLVKGVAITYPDGVKTGSTRLRLTSLSRSKPKSAVFKNIDTGQSFKFFVGDSLAEANSDLSGITVESIGNTDNPAIKSGITLSNGQILAERDTVASETYSETYQSLMMRQSLKTHFETEWKNFQRSNKVKTLTLYFIDSVKSYRGEYGVPGHLRLRFEELLADELQKQIEKFTSVPGQVAQEYLVYLKASLADVSSTNGGYFSSEDSAKEEAIQAEVDQILRDKQKLLSFKNPDDTPNTMRFIFSKWTLREGWDNPNVFQIVKLRTSGSDISKLQEVGRGLRLPVDVLGNRLADEQFYLDYLIDFTESEFADKLKGEIEDSSFEPVSIRDRLPGVAEKLGKEPQELFIELLQKGLIDYNQEPVEGKLSDLYEQYPGFMTKKLGKGKVTNNQPKPEVKIRPERYQELKDLWESINQKYYLQLDPLAEDEIDKCVDEILDKDIYTVEYGRFVRERLERDDDGQLTVMQSTQNAYKLDTAIPYGEWLQQVYLRTYLPVSRIHAGLVRRNAISELPEGFFNGATLSKFVNEFSEWIRNYYLTRFSYTKVDGVLGSTSLTNADGEPLERIIQGNIGTRRDDTMDVPQKFLYDAFVFDSDKEKETIRDSEMDEVVVYGKIPRRSIRIPIYFGGTASPDFMYVLETADGNLSVNFIVETKQYELKNQMHGDDILKIDAARKFFETVSDSNESNFKIHFKPQLKPDDITALIKKITDPNDGRS